MKQPGKGSKVIKSIVGVIVIALALAGGWFGNNIFTSVSHHNASEAVQTMIAKLNKGDNAGAYNMLSANARGKMKADEFAAAMGDLKAENPKFSDTVIAFDGKDTAYYNTTEDGLPATSDGSTTGNIAVKLVKTGLTSWQVDSVSVN